MLFINKQFQIRKSVRALFEIILDVDISKQRYILYNFHRALIEIELSFIIYLKIGKELGRGD